MDKLFIVVPAYNEEMNIENVISEWYPIIEKHNGQGESRLVIVDDGSSDNTFEIAKKMEESRPLLTVHTKKNSGHGGTVLYGYKYALQEGAEYIFQTDSDGQTLPSEFEPFWELRNEYDMIIGKRSHRKDGFSRVFVTKVLKVVIQVCFGVNVKDANTPYRLMKADTMKKYIQLIPDEYFLSNVLLSVIYAKKALRVKYIPITFRERQGGKNSINIPRIIAIGRQAVGSFKSMNKEISI